MANEIAIRVSISDATGPGAASSTAQVEKLGKAAAGVKPAFEQAGKAASGFGAVLGRVGEIAAGVLVADALQAGAQRTVAIIKDTVRAASDLGESTNAVGRIFDTSSDKIIQWGKDNANSFGLSQRAFNQLATPLGAMLKNQGLAMDEVSDHTIKLTERAADMASVFNTDVADALTAIQAGLRGESDPLEQYGVSISAVAVEARALADTHKKSTAELSNQEKAVARLNIIYDQTASTAGDFASTADGLANAQRIATATIEDAQAKIGVAFTPVMARAAQVVGAFAETVTSMPQPVLVTTAAVIGLGAALLLLAPRFIATKDAINGMLASDSLAQRSMGKTAVFAAKAAGALTGISVAATAINAVLGGGGVNVQIEALAESMAKISKTGMNAGEGVRVFGGDLEKLKYDLGTLGSGFWAQFGNGIASVVEIFGDFGQDESLTKATERIAGIDAALASLVQQGRTAEAAAAFKFLSEQAKEVGISVDDLLAGLPQYAGAMQLATTGTKKVGDAAAGTARDIDAMDSSFDALIDKSFSLEETEDKIANAIQRLRDQLKQQKEDHEKGAVSLDRNTQAGRDNAAAVRDLIRDYEDLLVQYSEAGRSTDGLIKKLEDQLVAMGFSRQEAKNYTANLADVKAGLDAIPKTTTITVKSDVQQALEQIHETEREARRLTRQTFTVHIGASSFGSAPGRASGGITGAASGGARGGMTWVGEQGPELVRLPYGSTVMPAGTSREMARAGAATAGGGFGSVRPVELFGGGLGDVVMAWLRNEIGRQGGTLAVLGIRET